MPFGPYKDMDDCIKKNQDKDNPAGYCATIHKKITGKWPSEKQSYHEVRLKEILAKDFTFDRWVDIWRSSKNEKKLKDEIAIERHGKKYNELNALETKDVDGLAKYVMEYEESVGKKNSIKEQSPIEKRAYDFVKAALDRGDDELDILDRIQGKFGLDISRANTVLVAAKQKSWEEKCEGIMDAYGDEYEFGIGDIVIHRPSGQKGRVMDAKHSGSRTLIKLKMDDGRISDWNDADLFDAVEKIKLIKNFSEQDVDPEQLRMGIEVEMEHTDDPKIAKKIALDHLAEIPDYYTRLKDMEAKSKMKESDLDLSTVDGFIQYAVSLGMPDAEIISITAKRFPEVSRSIIRDYLRDYKAGKIAKIESYRRKIEKLHKEMVNNYFNMSEAIQVGKTYKVDMSKVRAFDNVPPYIRLVQDAIRNGGGKVYVAEIKDGFATVRAWENDFLGDVRIPIEALKEMLAIGKITPDESNVDMLAENIEIGKNYFIPPEFSNTKFGKWGKVIGIQKEFVELDMGYAGRTLLPKTHEVFKGVRKSVKLKEGGIGLLSGDARDVLEGIVIANKDKLDIEILALVKKDRMLVEEIRNMGISDNDLLEYIRNVKRIYRLHKEMVFREANELLMAQNAARDAVMQLEKEFKSKLSGTPVAKYVTTKVEPANNGYRCIIEYNWSQHDKDVKKAGMEEDKFYAIMDKYDQVFSDAGFYIQPEAFFEYHLAKGYAHLEYNYGRNYSEIPIQSRDEIKPAVKAAQAEISKWIQDLQKRLGRDKYESIHTEAASGVMDGEFDGKINPSTFKRQTYKRVVLDAYQIDKSNKWVVEASSTEYEPPFLFHIIADSADEAFRKAKEEIDKELR